MIALHGFGGSGRDWAALGCFDGSGRDRAAPGGFGAPDLHGRFESLPQAAETLLQELPPTFDLVGYSLGGRLALHIALAAPERVQRLALIGANPGLATEAERAERRAADERWAVMLETEGIEAFAMAWAAQPLFAGLDPARARAAKLRHDPHVLARDMRALGLGTQANLWPRLAELQMPVLWIAGADDAKFAAIAHQMPNAALVPGCGHNVLLERPDALARLLADFFPRFVHAEEVAL